MVLRKPYAFLIKHFKLLHIILTVGMIFSMYRTEMMIDFLNEYMVSNVLVIGEPIVATLYNVWVILAPALVLLTAIILLVVMSVKKKPRLYYILMVIVHVALIAIYIYGFTVFKEMQKTIVDVRIIKALRDVLLYGILFQGVFTIVSLIRGVGFDIKKFDFGHDLQELDISAKDNEEFEVSFDFDISDKTRKGKKIIRYLKYKYQENKFIFRITGGLLVFSLLVFGVYRYSVYHKTSPEGTTFNMNGFTLGATRSYLVNEDYRGNPIGDGTIYLVVVDMNVKNNSPKEASVKTGGIELNISGDIYHHTDAYDGMLNDLGIVYKNQNLTTEFEHYLLVYEIPITAINSKMKLGFTNSDTGETAYVKLKVDDLTTKEPIEKEYKLGEEMKLDESTLGKTTFKVESYELRNRFSFDYRYCTPRTKTCIDSVEYLTPNLYNSNYNKTLLRLDGYFNLDENFVSDNIKDIYSFFKAFAKIEYELNGRKKVQNVYLGEAKTNKADKNSYFIEVLQEIKAADKITLVFQIRDNTYRYSLK